MSVYTTATAPWNDLTTAARALRESAASGPAAGLLHPGAQRALAAWLESTAEHMRHQEAHLQQDGRVFDRFRQPHDDWASAMTLAAQIVARVQ
jgi:hypothetical protein